MTDNEAAQIANYTELAARRCPIFMEALLFCWHRAETSTKKADIAFCKFVMRFIYSFFFVGLLKHIKESKKCKARAKRNLFFLCHGKQSTKTKWFFRKNQWKCHEWKTTRKRDHQAAFGGGHSLISFISIIFTLTIVGFSGSIIFELISLFVFLLKTFEDSLVWSNSKKLLCQSIIYF